MISEDHAGSTHHHKGRPSMRGIRIASVESAEVLQRYVAYFYHAWTLCMEIVRSFHYHVGSILSCTGPYNRDCQVSSPLCGVDPILCGLYNSDCRVFLLPYRVGLIMRRPL